MNAQQEKKEIEADILRKDSTSQRSLTDKKDIYDVVSSIFKKPPPPIVPIVSDSVIAKPIYSVVPAIGYTLQTKTAAVIAGNVAFHISPEANISTISANATYTQNKQFFIHATSIISNKSDLYKYLGDYRFYKYPQSTFGLGSLAPIENEDPMDYFYIRIYQTVLRKIKGGFFLGPGYNLDHHWKISHEGNINGTPSDYSKYDTSSNTTSSGVTLNALFESRDNPINAKKGFFTSLQLRSNLKALGSNSNWQSLILDVRKYIRFPRNSPNTLAFWSYNTVILNGKPPYLDLPSTGWDSYNSTGRGFIQGRYRGTKMVYLETEYRFRISSNGLFGGVVFVNDQAFSSVPGSRLQPFQPGFGTGLRIKLNKHSDTNLSIDYGFGTQGSKGLFINVGELF